MPHLIMIKLVAMHQVAIGLVGLPATRIRPGFYACFPVGRSTFEAWLHCHVGMFRWDPSQNSPRRRLQGSLEIHQAVAHRRYTYMHVHMDDVDA